MKALVKALLAACCAAAGLSACAVVPYGAYAEPGVYVAAPPPPVVVVRPQPWRGHYGHGRYGRWR